MSDILIKRGLIITPKRIINGDLLLRNGKIEAIESRVRSSHAKVIDANGMYVSPGFIDTHVNGGGGREFMECDRKAFQTILDFHLQHGTTGMLPTAVTAPLEQMRKFLELVNYFQSVHPAVLGAHLNGPFVSPQMAGAMDLRYIRPPSSQTLYDLVKGLEHTVKIVTLAPEEPGAQELISAIITMEATPSLGHSNATYDETIRAVDWGVRHFTHFFNAMRGFHHREPGAVGAAWDIEGITLELIADGRHVHEAAIRLLIKLKGSDNILLVTDATRAAGLKDGRYSLGSTPIVVKNGIARTESGIFAGSTLTMERALANFQRFTRLDLVAAIRTVSLNPARLLEVEGVKGSIEIGKDADIVIFDSNFKVFCTLVQGEIVYEQ